MTASEGLVTHLGYSWYGPDYDFEEDVYKATYNNQDGTVGVDIYYDAQPWVFSLSFGLFGNSNPIVIPDYITAWMQGRERLY